MSLFLFAFSAFQVRNESLYREEWYKQESLLWQMAWRAPDLEPGTSVIADGVPKSLVGNHSSGILDMLYGRSDSGGRLDYFIFDLSVISDEEKRYAGKPVNYRPGEQVTGRVRSYEFEGTTSQSLVVWVSPQGTLHLVSPAEAKEILKGPVLCENLSFLSNPEMTIKEGSGIPQGSLLKIFQERPKDQWLFYYQRAELERQLQNWRAIAQLGDKALQEGDRPVDVSEWFPFVDGYIRTGHYEVAANLSKLILDGSPDALVPLSSLWSRALSADSGRSPELAVALHDMGNRLVIKEP